MIIKCIQDYKTGQGACFTKGREYEVVYTRNGRLISAIDDHGFNQILSHRGWFHGIMEDHFKEEQELKGRPDGG